LLSHTHTHTHRGRIVYHTVAYSEMLRIYKDLTVYPSPRERSMQMN